MARKLHGGSSGGGAAHASGSKHGLQPAAELFKKMVETIRSSNGLMVSGGITRLLVRQGERVPEMKRVKRLVWTYVEGGGGG